MSGDVVWLCDDCATAAGLVHEHIMPGSVILLKGSRGFKLERVIDKLL